MRWLGSPGSPLELVLPSPALAVGSPLAVPAPGRRPGPLPGSRPRRAPACPVAPPFPRRRLPAPGAAPPWGLRLWAPLRPLPPGTPPALSAPRCPPAPAPPARALAPPLALAPPAPLLVPPLGRGPAASAGRAAALVARALPLQGRPPCSGCAPSRCPLLPRAGALRPGVLRASDFPVPPGSLCAWCRPRRRPPAVRPYLPLRLALALRAPLASCRAFAAPPRSPPRPPRLPVRGPLPGARRRPRPAGRSCSGLGPAASFGLPAVGRWASAPAAGAWAPTGAARRAPLRLLARPADRSPASPVRSRGGRRPFSLARSPARWRSPAPWPPGAGGVVACGAPPALSGPASPPLGPPPAGPVVRGCAPARRPGGATPLSCPGRAPRARTWRPPRAPTRRSRGVVGVRLAAGAGLGPPLRLLLAVGPRARAPFRPAAPPGVGPRRRRFRSGCGSRLPPAGPPARWGPSPASPSGRCPRPPLSLPCRPWPTRPPALPVPPGAWWWRRSAAGPVVPPACVRIPALARPAPAASLWGWRSVPLAPSASGPGLPGRGVRPASCRRAFRSRRSPLLGPLPPALVIFPGLAAVGPQPLAPAPPPPPPVWSPPASGPPSPPLVPPSSAPGVLSAALVLACPTFVPAGPPRALPVVCGGPPSWLHARAAALLPGRGAQSLLSVRLPRGRPWRALLPWALSAGAGRWLSGGLLRRRSAGLPVAAALVLPRLLLSAPRGPAASACARLLSPSSPWACASRTLVYRPCLPPLALALTFLVVRCAASPLPTWRTDTSPPCVVGCAS